MAAGIRLFAVDVTIAARSVPRINKCKQAANHWIVRLHHLDEQSSLMKVVKIPSKMSFGEGQPPHAQENDFSFIVAPFEASGFGHEQTS